MGGTKYLLSTQMENFLHLECVQYRIVVHANANDLQEKPQPDDGHILNCRIPHSTLAASASGTAAWSSMDCTVSISSMLLNAPP